MQKTGAAMTVLAVAVVLVFCICSVHIDLYVFSHVCMHRLHSMVCLCVYVCVGMCVSNVELFITYSVHLIDFDRMVQTVLMDR